MSPGGRRPVTEDGLVDRELVELVDQERVRSGELLTIGAFAARSRLSPKALRLYDRLGLLPPAHVDATTGYRYYRADQAERARMVALLRRLDMPLARIAEVVEPAGLDGPSAADRLACYWAEAEARFASQRTLAEYLRGRLSGRSSEMYGKFVVETVDVPEQVLITQTRHILPDELPTWIGAALGRLEDAAQACGGRPGRRSSRTTRRCRRRATGRRRPACRSPTRPPRGRGPRNTGGPGTPGSASSRPGVSPTPASRRPRWQTRRSTRPSRRWRSGSRSGG
uniref:HTH merR-type domain-containing protein n=1 Tax=Streptomyces avermitilis TaxID=33903 RepID=A0A499VPX9_STRAX|nr:hypothetical protein SAVMC3_43400 [Streptomyces avermitilis]